MNPSQALCPKCLKEVAFVEANGRRTCSACGWSHEIGGASVAGSDALSTAWTILRVFVWVAVITVAIVGVGLAVVFDGCVM
jgi:hypothetical protein